MKCGAHRTGDDLAMTPRQPCTHCGGTAVRYVRSFHAVLAPASDSIALSVSPADQERGWAQRWRDIQRDHQTLTAPRSGSVSAAAIQQARHQLHSFYIQAYHLKDALKEEAATTGVTGQAVEDVVSRDPTLALLADLANLDKHGVLNRPPRSNHVPRIVSVSGTSDTGAAGWRLQLNIEHNATTIDGLTVATAAVDAWQRALVAWKLI
jgi:hypothetical protein